MRSLKDTKEEKTATMARKITEAEKANQDAKTARLREARLAKEVTDAANLPSK